MPSGAKKRKAAKKKKEKEANISPSTNNPQGNDDLKSQDEKGSDGGEGSSPAYHDRDDHHHPFNERSEEVEEGDPSVAYPPVSDIKPMEEVPSDITNAEVVGGQELSVVKIESDLKSEESSDRVNDSVENVKFFEESLYGSRNSSGTFNVEPLNENRSKDELNNSKQKEGTAEDLTYPVNSSAEVGGGHEAIVKIDSGLKSEKSSDRIIDSVAYIDSSAYPVDSSSTKMSLTSENAAVKETSNLVVEPYVNSVKEVASLCEVKNSDNESALLEVSQVAAVDLAMKKHEDKVYPLPNQHITTPDLVESLPAGYSSKVSASVSENPTPVTESTRDADHTKGSETPEYSENQPQIVSAPRMMQKTSLLNCCGLFEVLSGSNR